MFSSSTTLTPASRQFVAITGFVAGHAVLPNVWFHAGWLLIGGLLCFRELCMPNARSFAPVWLFLGWMTSRSLFSSGSETASGMLSVTLLALVLVLLWNARSVVDRCGRWSGHLAALAAVISFGWHFHRCGVNFEDFRLENVLVHGGLNAVCTGLTFGFFALWLSAMPMTRWTTVSALVLNTAAFCSASRGAMLAMLAGHAVLWIATGWRRSLRPLIIFGTAFALYSATGFNTQRPTQAGETTMSVAAPLQRAISRPNEGRLTIYRAGWSCLDSPTKHLLGIGQFGTRSCWQQRLDQSLLDIMGHLHSAFFSTYVHGGIIGACLLLFVLIRVASQAIFFKRDAAVFWPALFGYGLVALIFDGESLAHWLTLPRFETLLFWLPVTMLLAQASESSQAASCRPAA